MTLLRPFRGLRPPRELAAAIACPPYDVVNAGEARAYAGANPRSFFRISRPEIDLPPGTDEHAPEVHARGAANLHAFEAAGWLRRDAVPRYYLYRQGMGSHVQTGLVATASVAEYEAGAIRRHELTRPDKEDDRTRHIMALGGNDEPVFLTFRAEAELGALLAAAAQGEPEYDFTSEDGIRHSFWCVPDSMTQAIGAACARLPRLYIADGHHRSAAAARAHRLYREQGRAGGHDAFLAVAFPHDELRILDYNRVVADLNGLAPQALLQRVAEKFTLEPAPEPQPAARHQFGMYLAGHWHRLSARPGSFAPTPVGALDVSILQENLLGPLLGIADPRTDPRIGFVGGSRGLGELERLVDSGRAQVAFALFPTGLDELMAIADAGAIMPPKSTWFEPKLRSGLVLHPFF